MIIFDYQKMFDFILDIAYDEDLDSRITERLQEGFSDFENGFYNPEDLEIALTANQKILFEKLFDDEDFDSDKEYAKHLKRFNKLKRDFIFETVSRMCFLYGMACAADILRDDKK